MKSTYVTKVYIPGGNSAIVVIVTNYATLVYPKAPVDPPD